MIAVYHHYVSQHQSSKFQRHRKHGSLRQRRAWSLGSSNSRRTSSNGLLCYLQLTSALLSIPMPHRTSPWIPRDI
ncbi:hypothetical protein BJX70DRAFT_151052 [Aspergillus crustosus]